MFAQLRTVAIAAARKKVYKCESEDVKVLEMGRSRPCSSASSLLSSVGVCGRFVLPQQQQRRQQQQSPHGRQAVVQPPLLYDTPTAIK